MGQPITFGVKRFRPRRYQPGNLKTWSGHLPFAHDLVASLRPSVLVELGTHFGESYFGFCQAVEENRVDCRCYAVDTWRGDEHAGFYHEHVFDEVNNYNRDNYSSFSFLLRDTFDLVSSRFETGSIDLLHIDGLHTYEAVKNDFETWLPKVRAGGIILMHDIHARHANFGVWKLWDELKPLYRNFEFVHCWGLGVLQIGSESGEQPDLLRLLFSSSEADQRAVREHYVMAAENLEFAHTLAKKYPNAERAMPVVQVFAARHGGFKEEHSGSAAIEPGAWQRHVLLLEQGCEMDGLRIDLADCPGVIHVAGITVRRAVDQAVILQITDPGAIRALPCLKDLLPLPVETEAKFLSYGPDPQLLVESGRPNELTQPLAVEVWMRLRLDLTEVAEMLRSSTAPVVSAPVAAAAERADMERLVALGKVETLRAELRNLQTERLVLTSECRRLASGRQALEAQMDDVREFLRREQTLRIELERSAADLRAEVAQLKWASRQEAGLREELREERGRRKDLENSYCWRATAPVRSALKFLNFRGAGARSQQ